MSQFSLHGNRGQRRRRYGTHRGSSPFHRPIENHYGGESLLTNVNGPESQSTTVPQTWEEKQRAISIIGEITRPYGYEAPTIDGLENWSAEDRIRELAGLTPDKQVIVSGVALGRAGQWLSLWFQDLSKVTNGTFEERLVELRSQRSSGSGRPQRIRVPY